MAICNIIGRQEILNRLRIEAEFYRPEYVAAYNAVARLPHVKLRPYSEKISDGTHFTPRYTQSGVRFYSALNVKRGFFADDESYKFISQSEHADIYRRCPVEAGDVLLRKVGVGPRWSCVVPEGLEEFSIFVSVALIRPKPVLMPEFLSTFINSRYGQLQLLRLNKGVTQPDLHLEDIGELIVPVLNPEEQVEIAALVQSAQCSLETGKTLHRDAQKAFESELALHNLRLHGRVGPQFSIVPVGNTFETRRFDAQCFAPDAVASTEWLRKYGRCEPLKELIENPIKGRQQAETAVGTDYCSIKHVSKREILARAKCICQPGTPTASRDDLLLAITGATIGKIGINKRYDRLAFSGDLLRLRVLDTIDSHYLLLVLDHPIGQIQFVRWISGSTNGHLASQDAGKILVPRLGTKTEKRIAELVKLSLVARAKSEELLHSARTRVEKHIEARAK
jgi:type I restriction enzyme, S subunit